MNNIEDFLKNKGGKILYETCQGSAWVWFDDKDDKWVLNRHNPRIRSGIEILVYDDIVEALKILEVWAWERTTV